MQIIIKSPETIRESAKAFVEAMGDSTIFAFYGSIHQGYLRGNGRGRRHYLSYLCHCK